MKKIALLLFVLAFILCGCGKQDEPPAPGDTPGITGTEYHTTVPVGTVPQEFEKIVAQNLFYSATAYGDRLLQVGFHFVKNLIRVYDPRGEVLVEKVVLLEDCEKIGCAFLTEDGGLVYTFGTDIHYGKASYDIGDVSSHIYFYDGNGKYFFSKDVAGCEIDAFQAGIETDAGFFFFGSLTEEKNGKKTVGEGQTDISVIKIFRSNHLITKKTFGGSGYEYYFGVTYDEAKKNFVISAITDSTDGDFSFVNDEKTLYHAILPIGENFMITEAEEVDSFSLKRRVGILDGKEIFDDDEMFEGFADGKVTALVDYGDFYLIVSENITGIDMNMQPYSSAVRHTTETVYAAYGKDGTLIWKAACDSSNMD